MKTKKIAKISAIIREERDGYARELLSEIKSQPLSQSVLTDIKRMSISLNVY